MSIKITNPDFKLIGGVMNHGPGGFENIQYLWSSRKRKGVVWSAKTGETIKTFRTRRALQAALDAECKRILDK